MEQCLQIFCYFSEGRALHVCSFVFSLRFGALDFGIYLIFEVGRDLQIVFFFGFWFSFWLQFGKMEKKRKKVEIE